MLIESNLNPQALVGWDSETRFGIILQPCYSSEMG